MYGLEYLSDPKIKSLNANERSCWITILCYASVSSVEGEILHLGERQIMLDAGVDPLSDSWKDTEGILQRFAKLGMIEVSDGLIRVTNWNKRQFKTLSGYDRIKRHRDRKKNSENIELHTQLWFEKFWAAYPRKIGKKKAKAIWEKLNPDETLVNKIIEAISAQGESVQWKKDGGVFIPHPSTWLNGERWNDEMKTTQNQQKANKYSKV